MATGRPGPAPSPATDAGPAGPGTASPFPPELRRYWEDAITPDARPEATLRPRAAAPSAGGTAGRLSSSTEPQEGADDGQVQGGAGDALPRDLVAPSARFVLQAVLGEGGMGRVYRALQGSVGRQVAVKVIRPELAHEGEPRRHFLSEAMVTGGLDHPNVVPIHDVGVAPDGTVFYAMKEVRGTPWSDVIAHRTEEENLDVLLRVADAVAFAHSKGVIHRDLKPENVMLGDYGEVLLMDWGLAVRAGPDGHAAERPASGAGGTPAYLAPEMALALWDRIGTASDIYLLGGILYEIATGLRPHAGDGVMGCLAAAADNRIQPADRDDELVRIARKAMAAEPAQRYANVKAFQQAVRGYRQHAQSIALAARAQESLARARRGQGSAVYREADEAVSAFRQALALWPGNIPAVKGLRHTRELLAECALAHGDLALAQSQVTAISEECRQHDQLSRETDPGADASRESLPEPTALAGRVRAAALAAARRDRVARLSRRAAALAAAVAIAVSVSAYLVTRRQRDRAVQAETAEAAQRRLAEAARRRADDALAGLQRENYAHLIALAERRIAAGETVQAEALLWHTPPELRHWEWGRCLYLCHRELLTLAGHDSAVVDLGFSPDGARLLSADGVTARLWDLRAGGDGSALKGSNGARCAAFSPDGTRVATGHGDSSVVLWDAATRVRTQTLPGRRVPVGAVAFSPDDALVAGAENGLDEAAGDSQTRVWNIATGSLVATLRSHRPQARCLRFSPDGQRLLTVATDAIHIWDVRSGKELLAITVNGVCAAFSPDGATVYVAAARGQVVAWDSSTGEPRATFAGHGDLVFAIAVSANGARIFTASADRTARVWDAASGDELQCIGTQAPAWSLALAPDGRMVATSGPDGAIRLWDLAGCRDPVAVAGRLASFTDGHSRVVTAGSTWIRSWDARTGERLAELSPAPAGPRLAQSADGHRLLTGQADGEAVLWDLSTGQRLADLEGHEGPFSAVAFSADATRLAGVAADAATHQGSAAVALWDASTGRRLLDLAGHQRTVRSVQFSADGRRVVTGSEDGTARVWDAGTGRELAVLQRSDPRPAPILAVAASPDGRHIVTGHAAHHGNVAVIWDIASGRELHVLAGHSSRLASVAYSPDGRRVFTASRDLTVRVWDATSGQELLVIQRPGPELPLLTGISADGRSLALAGPGGSTVVLNTLDWTLPRDAIAPMKLAAYRAWLDRSR